MRVGLLAKEMILRGDLSVELVLMCASTCLSIFTLSVHFITCITDKPTKEQLHEVSENLPAKLAVSNVCIFQDIICNLYRFLPCQNRLIM